MIKCLLKFKIQNIELALHLKKPMSIVGWEFENQVGEIIISH